MTRIEKLAAFTESLPEDRRADFERALEEVLDTLMDAYSPEFDLTADELAEIERRMADPDPKYADPKDIAAIFGTTFDD